MAGSFINTEWKLCNTLFINHLFCFCVVKKKSCPLSCATCTCTYVVFVLSCFHDVCCYMWVWANNANNNNRWVNPAFPTNKWGGEFFFKKVDPTVNILNSLFHFLNAKTCKVIKMSIITYFQKLQVLNSFEIRLCCLTYFGVGNHKGHPAGQKEGGEDDGGHVFEHRVYRSLWTCGATAGSRFLDRCFTNGRRGAIVHAAIIYLLQHSGTKSVRKFAFRYISTKYLKR